MTTETNSAALSDLMKTIANRNAPSRDRMKYAPNDEHIPGLDHPAVQGSIARHSNDAPAPQHEAYAQGGWTTWSAEQRAYVWKGTHAERVAKRIAEYEASVRQCAHFTQPEATA